MVIKIITCNKQGPITGLNFQSLFCLKPKIFINLVTFCLYFGIYLFAISRKVIFSVVPNRYAVKKKVMNT